MKSAEAGRSLLDVLVVLTLIGLASAWSAPLAARILVDAKTAAAAREFAMRFHAMRWRSVEENRYVGFWFERTAGNWCWWEVRDGNGNGLRTAEILDGTDPKHSGPHRVESTHSGVALGFPAGAAPTRIPPERGVLPTVDPVRFGRSDIVSFAPDGRASSGTLYLTDGRRRLWGVRLYGAAGRVRVWRWDARERAWRR